MGEVSETTMTTTTTTKRKKKGRPSLLDLQKRSLKKQQKQNPNLINDPYSNINNDDEDERKQKKQKLLIGLNSQLQNPTTLFSNSQTPQFHPNHPGSDQNVSFRFSIAISLSLFTNPNPIINSILKPFQFQFPSLNFAEYC